MTVANADARRRNPHDMEPTIAEDSNDVLQQPMWERFLEMNPRRIRCCVKVSLHLRLVSISSIRRKSYIDVINVGYIGETAHLDLLIGLHMKLIITLTFDTTPPLVALSCLRSDPPFRLSHQIPPPNDSSF
jgi:hypothetical protein